MASIWEIAIKISIGKLEMSGSIPWLVDLINENGFKILPISINHIDKVINLEFHHRDPFDRLLIAQSIVDNLIFVTKDQTISNYQINIFW